MDTAAETGDWSDRVSCPDPRPGRPFEDPQVVLRLLILEGMPVLGGCAGIPAIDMACRERKFPVSNANYLNYRKRKIEIREKNLTHLLQQLSRGEYLIPTFQRFFVWEAEAICSLWNSLYHCYPIGSILYWKTRARLHVHRKIGGFFIPENAAGSRGERFYILDGQQRLTSLFVSFYGGKGTIKNRMSFDYTLYFDLAGEVFFFEKDYHRHRWDAEAAFLLRLRDVPDLPPDYERVLALAHGFSPAISRNFQQLKYLFQNYRIPMICLENFDVPSVCAVYERINQNGVKLDNLDILIARSFKNDPTIIDEDFPDT